MIPSFIELIESSNISQVHSLGLKLGIYEDIGTLTCGGYPGIQGHEEEDMKTFAEWDVDYVKLDGCYMEASEFGTGTPLDN